MEVKLTRSLLLDICLRLVVPTENGTFQDNASKVFNNLPETIRNCKGICYVTEYRVIS